jgi:hypothetical protein
MALFDYFHKVVSHSLLDRGFTVQKDFSESFDTYWRKITGFAVPSSPPQEMNVFFKVSGSPPETSHAIGTGNVCTEEPAQCNIQ